MSTPAPTITVSLAIDNIYPGEVIRTSAKNVVVPAPEDVSDTGALEEWAAEHLLAYTGTGRVDGDSSYDLTVTASQMPELIGRTFEFD